MIHIQKRVYDKIRDIIENAAEKGEVEIHIAEEIENSIYSSVYVSGDVFLEYTPADPDAGFYGDYDYYLHHFDVKSFFLNEDTGEWIEEENDFNEKKI